MDYPRICPARWFSDPNFGMGMPHDFMYPFYDIQSNYYRPWKSSNQSISKEFGSTIENDKGNYKITLDVQHFRPEDISVKVSDKEIIVEGKHEERQDSHGYISRQFMRRYPLPSHCPADNVTSTLSSDGILTIIAQKQTTIAEKIVPIKMCGVYPKKTIVESKIASEIAEKTVKENIKERMVKEDIKEKAVKEEIKEKTIKDNIKESGDITSMNKSQIMLKEDHSRLLKPELLGEKTILETNGKMASKQTIEMGMSEKKSAINMGAASNKIEESLAKSSMAESTEQLLGQKNIASTSEMCSMKGMSQTRIEESSSSYKSSSMSMSSTIKSSGKMGECVSDIISAELREAAENV